MRIRSVQNQSLRLDDTEESLHDMETKIPAKSQRFVRDILEKNRTFFRSGVTPFGLIHGSGYIRYYDYKVELSRFGSSASMVEFVLVNGGNDEIIPTGCMNPQVSGFGELGQIPVVEVTREKEDIATNRWALANAHWYNNYPLSTPWGGSSASGTKYLWIGVGNDTYKVSDDLPY